MSFNEQLDFKIFSPKFFILLSSLKILRNDEVTYCRKLLDTIVTTLFISLSLLLIISQIFDMKNIIDLASFVEHMNPIFFHLLGSYKWISSIMRFNDIEELIDKIKHCHKLSLNIINDYDKGSMINLI